MTLMYKAIFAVIFVAFYTLPSANSQVVCSLDELLKELFEDLDDNGKLDCLRKSQVMDPNESEERRKKRILANWDGDCSFESSKDENDSYDWRKIFIDNYNTAFVDVNGNQSDPKHQDFEDQADMCEMIRALVASNSFSFGSNMNNISLELLDKIDCTGSSSQTQICAATGSSFAEKASWVIFLQGQSMMINGFPKYKINPNNRK